ncbi:hypothetical protein E2C01_071066 [Portunus trituberculatus]|uniref:Endonuclease/exonuclease/phosphatase domain-containing protein n=1 Tax=Portunus trituberculatus TaxID=210409 RepID=A0A5B7I5A2_PORTR|nr:hypothetical protein [Portunus trituberculatus]
MQKEVLNCLDNMLRKDRRVLLVGDLNCKHVNWEEMDANSHTGCWGRKCYNWQW